MVSDECYMRIAKRASMMSRCRKRQLGCVLVLKNDIFIEGTNGAPYPLEVCNPCPRIDSHAGQNLHLCRAVHAERQTLLKAARFGLSTYESRLFSYMGVPCKDCMIELIAAGTSEIICSQNTYYDELSKDIIKEWISKGGKLRFIKI